MELAPVMDMYNRLMNTFIILYMFVIQCLNVSNGILSSLIIFYQHLMVCKLV